MKCGYKWAAPYIYPDKRRGSKPQECVLEKGHDGDHRSITNVIAPIKKEPS